MESQNSLINPVPLRIFADPEDRHGDLESFGKPGARWAAALEVITGDQARPEWGPARCAEPEWRHQRFFWRARFPALVGIDVFLIVRSPSFSGAIEYVPAATVEHGLVQHSFDVSAAKVFVRDFYSEIGPVTRSELKSRLSLRFYVEEF